jgi:hypothetical protein
LFIAQCCSFGGPFKPVAPPPAKMREPVSPHKPPKGLRSCMQSRATLDITTRTDMLRCKQKKPETLDHLEEPYLNKIADKALTEKTDEKKIEKNGPPHLNSNRTNQQKNGIRGSKCIKNSYPWSCLLFRKLVFAIGLPKSCAHPPETRQWLILKEFMRPWAKKLAPSFVFFF